MAALSSPTSPKPSLVVDLPGAYTASLVVNDGKLSSAANFVTITAAAANVVPVANAGVAQNVLVGTLVTLNGASSSDANGDRLTYHWVLASKPAGSTDYIGSPNSVSPTFTADLPGAYTASLVVNDGQVDSALTSVSLVATTANAAPVANAGTSQEVNTGSFVTLNGSASSDANSDTLTFLWSLTAKPPGSAATLISPTTAYPSLTTDVAGTYVASLVVNDGKTNSATSTVAITATTPVESTGLRALFGRLDLKYKFYGDTYTFTDSVNFSASSLSPDGKNLVGSIIQSQTRMIGCFTLNNTEYAYGCMISGSLYGATELFLFNISGKVVTGGAYEYCLAGTSLSSCVASLVMDPDGYLLSGSGISAIGRSYANEVAGGSEIQASKQAFASSLSKPERTQISTAPTQQISEVFHAQIQRMINSATLSK